MPLPSHPQQPHNVSAIRDGLTANVANMALTQQSSLTTTSASNTHSQQPQPQSQPQSQSQSQQMHLPPPQTFDILPALHELLARIDPASTTLPDQQNASAGIEIGAGYTDLAPLEPKDLPAEVLQIKAKIRRAVKELEKLPDMERGVEEQEEEIRELEGRIEKQKAVVGTLGGVAREMRGEGDGRVG